MKKFIIAASILACSTAFAHGPAPRHYSGGNAQWLVPAIIAGAIVYEATRPAPVVIQPQPQVIVQQPQPVYVQPVPRLNEYKEPPLTTRNGEVYVPVPVQPQYVERIMYDQTCACYRKFLQQIN